ncbi:MAG: hypothetical protein J7J96_08900, partial [Sulfurimonas sp.]|nr:hypothetical protein [Sulfurimonas sp.]
MISKESDYIHLRKVVFAVVCIWTLVILCSLFWNISNEYKDMRTLAENTARGAFKKDQSFRFWSTSHGGVYVPRDKRTISNPNLAHIADRDIKKPDGTNLTLMNPVAPFNKIANKNIFAIILWHVGFWIIVILGVLFFAFREMIYIQRKMDTKNELKENQIYLKNLFESTPNIMITTNGDEIDIANTTALDFFEFNSVEEFKNKHQCICDFFIDGDGLLSSEMDGVVWLEYILTNQDELHKVKMRNSVKIHTFLVWAKPLFIDKNSRSVVT